MPDQIHAQSEPPAKDTPVLRYLKFASIVLVLAVVGGGALAAYDYFAKELHSNRVERNESRREVERDTVTAMKGRFFFGAAVGAAIGSAYVARCIFKRADP